MPDLTVKYEIPRYAQELLFLVCGSQVAQTEGPHGEYSLDNPDSTLELHYGRADGPILAIWQDAEDPSKVVWNGQIKIGGFVERLHGRELGDLEVVIAEIVGGPLPSDHVGLASLSDMRNGIFARSSDVEPLRDDQVYPFIILAESNLASLAQDALVSGLAVDAFGILMDEASKWHKIVGLPLQLDSLTLLAP